MAALKIQKIVSFSSEDPLYPASNLLKKKKWKCKDEGEKQAWVLLKLEDLSTITNINIGNAGSAFVEVQVGRQGCDLDQMKVLMVATSFMSVNESRVGDQQGRVKMIDNEKLAGEIAKEKWDLVKVVATQPFTKQMRYGISFIELCGIRKEVTEVKTEKVNRLGAFKLKPESESDISVGSYFSRKKEESEGSVGSPSVAATMRSETSLAQASLVRSREKDSKRKFEMSPAAKEEVKRRKVDTPFPSRQSLPGESSVSESPKLKERDRESFRKKENLPVKNTPNKDLSQKKNPEKEKDENIKHRKNEIETSNQSKKTRPQKFGKFRELLKGVHFTISGFQNPLRGEIRQKGLEMGAKYYGDWNSSSTHLICAFTNTPKFNQVRGKGKIVKKDWLEECHRQRKRLPWRRFCLDKRDKDAEESEEEVWEEVSEEADYDCDTDEEIERIQAAELREKEAGEAPRQISSKNEASSSAASSRMEDSEENKENVKIEKKTDSNAYECDTDDEIEQCLKNNEEEDPYEVETDIDDEEVERLLPDTSNLPFETLPNFFGSHQFFFHGSFPEDERLLLERYVTSAGGKVKLYMDTEVNFVITKTKDEKQFKDAKEVNTDVKFVLPNWIFSCNDEQKLVSVKDYSFSL